MSLKEYIGGQFAEPEGIGGAFAAKIMNVMNAEHYRAVERFVCKDDGAKILDIGFGNGHMLKILDKKLNAKLYGIDISPDMIEKASRKNGEAVSLNRMALQMANITELPYNDNFFDTVYTINTVYFWGDLTRAFDEIRRVLKDGGNFVCTFYSKNYLDTLAYCDTGFDKFTPQELRSLARENGFHDVKVKILKEGKSYCLIGQKFAGV